MSTFVPKPFTFTLFVNDKDGVETRPDWNGYLVLADGEKYWISGWDKTTQSGEKMISGALKPADVKVETQAETPQEDPGEVVDF